ncbi:MAG: pantoate--beta-alanine ligase [Fimbriimonadaceae bacterium]
MLRTVAEVRAARAGMSSVGLVPTMGAFHDGHLELMLRCKASCSFAIVSLFVNPAQFAEGEDFSAYPRDEERDLSLASSVGVDFVWAPSVDEVYAPGVPSLVAGPEAARWEGEHRPRHFDGVATVVARLFDVVRPDVAYFGLKDLQQCAVIRAMVASLGMPVRLKFVETVREPSGLAMSSRNAYFTDEQKTEAALLFRALSDCALAVRNGRPVEASLAAARRELESGGFALDYVACVDPVTMEPATSLREGLRVVVAARFCGVRLIDNVPV